MNIKSKAATLTLTVQTVQILVRRPRQFWYRPKEDGSIGHLVLELKDLLDTFTLEKTLFTTGLHLLIKLTQTGTSFLVERET